LEPDILSFLDKPKTPGYCRLRLPNPHYAPIVDFGNPSKVALTADLFYIPSSNPNNFRPDFEFEPKIKVDYQITLS